MSVSRLGVLLSAVFSMVIGSAWYGPLFGKSWIKAMNMTQKDIENAQEGMRKIYLISFLNALVSYWVFAHFVLMNGAETLGSAMVTGFWIWFGFLLTQQVSSTLWSKKPSFVLVVINASYCLVTILVSSILLYWL